MNTDISKSRNLFKDVFNLVLEVNIHEYLLQISEV